MTGRSQSCRTSLAEKTDFVIPDADVLNEGTKTIIRNMALISDRARRNGADIARYLGKEFSVPVNMEEQRLVITANSLQMR